MSKKVLKNIACVLFAVVMTAALSACGSGGGDNTPSVKSVIVSGVAATGAPVKGKVYLKDSGDPAVVLETTINPNGSYKFVVNGLTPPFYIKVKGEGVDGVELYSVAMEPGIANANPLSTVAVAAAGGVTNPADVYDDPAANPIDQTGLDKALEDLKTIVTPVLGAYKANDNPITAPFAADHKGLDAFFDDVNVDIVSGVVMFTDGLDRTKILHEVPVDGLDVADPLPDTPKNVDGQGSHSDLILEIWEEIDKSTGSGSIYYNDMIQMVAFYSSSITSVIVTDNVVTINGSGTVEMVGPSSISGCLFTAEIKDDDAGGDLMGMEIDCEGDIYGSEGLQPITEGDGYTVLY